MKKKINLITNKLNKFGYCIVQNVLKNKECLDYLNSVKKLNKSITKDKNHQDELAKYGQIIIRDLVLRDPKTFKII